MSESKHKRKRTCEALVSEEQELSSSKPRTLKPVAAKEVWARVKTDILELNPHLTSQILEAKVLGYHKPRVQFHEDGVSLSHLNLSGLRLVALPGSIGQLRVKGSVVLQFNRLTRLPEALGNLEVEQDLRLNDNLLEELPNLFCKNIIVGRNLNLKSNRIATVPEAFSDIHVGGTLSLQGNPIAHLEKGSRVCISGIKSRPELNGRIGVCTSRVHQISKGRCNVKIEGSGEEISIKETNLDCGCPKIFPNVRGMACGSKVNTIAKFSFLVLGCDTTHGKLLGGALINRDEVTSCLGLCFRSSNIREMASELVAKLARRNQINNGEIKGGAMRKIHNVYTEFPELSRKEIKSHEATFQKYDKDGNGTLDIQELKYLMEKVGHPQTHLGLKAMIKEVDDDLDGAMSFREFLTICELVFEGLKQLAESIDVDEVGVKSAGKFFEDKIKSINQSTKFADEIYAEREERKKENEEKKKRMAAFKAKTAALDTSTVEPQMSDSQKRALERSQAAKSENNGARKWAPVQTGRGARGNVPVGAAPSAVPPTTTCAPMTVSNVISPEISNTVLSSPEPPATLAAAPVAPNIVDDSAVVQTAHRVALYDCKCFFKHRYEAGAEDELGFVEGDVIEEALTVGEGWSHGRNQRTGLTGTFPSNYVEERISKAVFDAPTQSPEAPAPTPTLQPLQYMAIYDYQAAAEDEVGFVEGDLMKNVTDAGEGVSERALQIGRAH
eukprot:UC4_evm1s186